MPPITFELPIYTFQIDYNRHVSNIVYIQWMEIGRHKLMEAAGMLIHQTLQQGFTAVLVETTITYKRPLYLGDTVRAEVWISELTHVVAWIEFRFYAGDGVLAATGRQKGVFVNVETGRPIRLDAAKKAMFAPFLVAQTVAIAK